MPLNQDNAEKTSYRKIWGRRQGRPLKVNQKRVLEEVLPQVQIKLEEEQSQRIDPSLLFPNSKKYVLEVGFGGGEHLINRAKEEPESGFIGCEPFITGVASLLEDIETFQIKNIKVVIDDARWLLQRLPNESLDQIYILFPDPWPKKRHNKRRIVHDETIDDFSRVLKPGGQLIMATDISEYATWMKEVLSKRSEFTSQPWDMYSDSLAPYPRPKGWLITRYEKKGIDAGRSASFFRYTKT